MTAQQVARIGGVAIEEIFACLSIPGGATASAALHKVFENKAAEARNILFEEISRGGLPAMAEDDAVYIIYRYLRAAQEGAARINLKLMAKIIAGHSQFGELKADSFLYYADVISSLKAEEIKLLGIMMRTQKKTSYTAKDEIRKHFPEGKSEEIFQSLLRTGLVTFEQDVSVSENDDRKSSDKFISRLDTIYYLTSLMEEISRFIPWQEIPAENSDELKAA